MKKIHALAAVALSSAALMGCSTKHNTDFDYITGHLTPELQGSVERPSDVKRNMAVTNNMNWRLMSDDWGRVWYTNRPSTLTVLPVVATSGLPN